MSASHVFHTLMTLGGLMSFGASAPSTPTKNASVPSHEDQPASAGGSRTFQVISALPGAIGQDLSEIPSATFVAIGNFAQLIGSGLGSSAMTIIGVAGGTFSASVTAMTVYLKALNNPNKVRAWAIPMPSPLVAFEAKVAADFSPRGELAFTAALHTHNIVTSMINNIVLDPLIVTVYGAQLNPAHWSETINVISKRSAYLSITSDNRVEVLKDLTRIVSGYTPDKLKAEMKIRQMLLLKALDHLSHLFHKAVSARSNPESVTTFQLIKRGTKTFRAMLNPSNHSVDIRTYKVVIQLALCIILHHEFSEMQSVYLHHLKTEGKLPAAAAVFEASLPSPPSLPSSEDAAYFGGGGSMEQPAAVPSQAV